MCEFNHLLQPYLLMSFPCKSKSHLNCHCSYWNTASWAIFERLHHLGMDGMSFSYKITCVILIQNWCELGLTQHFMHSTEHARLPLTKLFQIPLLLRIIIILIARSQISTRHIATPPCKHLRSLTIPVQTFN